jgi:hypothetical protein
MIPLGEIFQEVLQKFLGKLDQESGSRHHDRLGNLQICQLVCQTQAITGVEDC